MKTVFWKCSLMMVALCCVCLGRPSSARAVSFVSTAGSTSNLVRAVITMAPNEQATFQTTGCSGNGDTVMYLLAGTPGQAGARVTAAYNDDAFGNFCSHIFFINGPVAKDYTLVIANYSPNFQATVTYHVWRSSTGVTLTAPLTVGGLRYTFSQSNTRSFQTVGLRPDQGGGPANGSTDTVLYVMNPTVGATSYFDDDSGYNGLSALGATLNCSNCALVAGTYSGYAGGKVRIWAKDQPYVSADNDGIPDEIETALGTNPNQKDTDGDGIPDNVELLGVYPNSGILGYSDGAIVMPWSGGTNDANIGSDPLVKDLFVEVDYMTNSVNPHDHNPTLATNWNTFAADTKSIFLSDNTWTGKTIRPHIEVSQSMTEVTNMSFFNCPAPTLRFFDRKNDPAWFNPLRASVYHYMIMGHNYLDQNCATTTSSGLAEQPGSDVMVTLGSFNAQVGTVNAQRGTFIHELGHNLNLSHNGNDSTSGANSCIHSSVMNYRYQQTSWGVNTHLRGWGYSNGQCSAPQVGGCSFSCTGGCVPAPQSLLSPKPGCGLGAAGCDCDVPEWATLNLNFSQSNLMGVGGVSPLEGRSDESPEARRDREVGEFFLGDFRRFGARHREFARKRKEQLIARGLIEGRDFQVEPNTGRTFSIEH